MADIERITAQEAKERNLFIGLDAPAHTPIAVDYGPKRGDSSIHEFRCGICGHDAHCSVCNKGTSGFMGHAQICDGKTLYSCRDADEIAEYDAVQAVKREAKERAELARLKAKYEQ